MENQVRFPTMENQMTQQFAGGGDLDHAEESGEEKLLIVNLPEEVVEMIIAKLPFPSLFKARLLSNSWNDKFFRLSRYLTLFQKEVKSMSNKWPVYSPTVFGRDGIRGFDRVTSQWKSLCTPFVTRFARYVSSGSFSFLGSLTLAISNFRQNKVIYVTNIMTGSSTRLHLELQERNRPVIAKILPGYSDRFRVFGDSDSFRILLLYTIWKAELRSYELHTAFYDSSVNRWNVTVSTNLLLEEFFHFFKDTIYLHGKLYCLYVVVSDWITLRLMIHHVDCDKTWTDHMLLRYPRGYPRSKTLVRGIFLCRGKILVALYLHHSSVKICELDLDSLQLVQVGGNLRRLAAYRHYLMGPESASHGYFELMQFASDDNFIYCGLPILGTRVMTYNLQSCDWGSLPAAFAPDPNFLPRNEQDLVAEGFPPASNEQDLMDEGQSILLGFAFAPGLNLFTSSHQSKVDPRLCLHRA